MPRRFLFYSLLAAVFVLGAGCASTGGIDTRADRDIVFSRDVLPVIRSSFLPLLTEDSGLDATSWEGLIAGSDQGEVLIPYDAERSLLIELAIGSGPDGPAPEEIELVRRWIEEGARNDDGEIPYADSDQLLYVTNQGSAVISVIDMEANLVIRTIDLRDLGYSENARPHHVAVSPDGTYWYVSLIGENTVLRFNRDNEVLGRAAFEVPGMLALDAETDRLYVGRSMTAVNPPQRIGVIEGQDMSVEEIDVFFPRPHALDATPGGGHLYVASMGVNQLASIDTETLDVELHEVTGPHHMFVQFAVAPDGRSMIVGGEMSGQLLFFDLSDPMQPELMETLDLGGAPWQPVFDRGGGRAFVPRKTTDDVAVIDMTTRTESAVISGPGIAEPDGSAIRPDGRYVYVSSSNLNGAFTPRYHIGGEPNGAVAVIDAATLEVVKVIEVENYPTGLGTRPAL